MTSEVSSNRAPVHKSIFDLVFKLIFWFMGFSFIFFVMPWLDFVFNVEPMSKLLFMTFLLGSVGWFWAWFNHYFIISENSLISTKGVFDKTEIVYSLDDLQMVTAHTSFLGRMLGYSDLKLQLDLISGQQIFIILSRVNSPESFVKEFQKFIKTRPH